MSKRERQKEFPEEDGISSDEKKENEDEEEEDDDDDDDDDDDVEDQEDDGTLNEVQNLQFDVCELRKRYAPHIQFLIDAWLPLPLPSSSTCTTATSHKPLGTSRGVTDTIVFAETVCNYALFGTVILAGEETDEEGDESQEEDDEALNDDMLGVIGILDVGSLEKAICAKSTSDNISTGKKNKSNTTSDCAEDTNAGQEIIALIESPVGYFSQGVAVSSMLRSSTSARCGLLVNSHMRNLPPQLIGQVFQAIDQDFHQAAQSPTTCKKQSQHQKQHGAATAIPNFQYLVVLAKIQRISALPKQHQEEFLLKQKAAGAAAGCVAAIPLKKNTKKKHRSEGNQQDEDDQVVGSSGCYHLKDYFFWREEDELLYQFRDERAAVSLHQCAPVAEGQPPAHVPMVAAFVVPIEALQKVAIQLQSSLPLF